MDEATLEYYQKNAAVIAPRLRRNEDPSSGSSDSGGSPKNRLYLSIIAGSWQAERLP